MLIGKAEKRDVIWDIRRDVYVFFSFWTVTFVETLLHHTQSCGTLLHKMESARRGKSCSVDRDTDLRQQVGYPTRRAGATEPNDKS